MKNVFSVIAFAAVMASASQSLACPEGSLELEKSCGITTSTGCCDANGSLLFCFEGSLCISECATESSLCGWDGNAYACGTSSNADPSGTFDRACCVPACSGLECGSDGCGGSCGTCASNEACEDGECVCIPYCDGKDCGSDGCGGSCGDCPDFFILDPFQWECTAQQVCICTPYCTGRECGNDGCGGSCGTCTGDERCIGGVCKIPDCKPYCDYTQCGPDPDCGISCGECSPGYSCNVWGQCIGSPCTPDCTNRECGNDGCGGSCGMCPAPEECVVNTCTGCIPDCTDLECGDNGCGGSCGTCEDGFGCQSGQCIELVCVPDCDGKDCGDDGCGGTCGVCKQPLVCRANQTCGEACTPNCDGLECGDDGCDGSCGTCEDGLTCESGLCVTISVSDDAVEDKDTVLDDIVRPVDTTIDTGIPSDNGPETSLCPEGSKYYYGQCIPIAGTTVKDGGCNAGRTPVSVWIPLALFGLVILGIRRRIGVRDHRF